MSKLKALKCSFILERSEKRGFICMSFTVLDNYIEKSYVFQFKNIVEKEYDKFHICVVSDLHMKTFNHGYIDNNPNLYYASFIDEIR